MQSTVIVACDMQTILSYCIVQRFTVENLWFVCTNPLLCMGNLASLCVTRHSQEPRTPKLVTDPLAIQGSFPFCHHRHPAMVRIRSLYSRLDLADRLYIGWMDGWIGCAVNWRHREKWCWNVTWEVTACMGNGALQNNGLWMWKKWRLNVGLPHLFYYYTRPVSKLRNFATRTRLSSWSSLTNTSRSWLPFVYRRWPVVPPPNCNKCNLYQPEPLLSIVAHKFSFF